MVQHSFVTQRGWNALVLLAGRLSQETSERKVQVSDFTHANSLDPGQLMALSHQGS